MSSFKNSERRKSVRHDTAIAGSLKCSLGSQVPITVVDLSAEGFSAGIKARAPMGGRSFAVRFGGLELLGASLRWKDDANAGFEFNRPLHPAVLDHVARQNPPDGNED
ncbi:hypothetical protein A6F68_00159 [Tsuneonella dongtanensis]|uniref:PilZ domain-containing protein n=2 Tax=Tsuneonella dongtanensis TaxID=692370 RepID=A0A1B2A9D8_9SPHN|nr:hypothetical protein A6F68_00159 [Tsuneonella dongtanensis]